MSDDSFGGDGGESSGNDGLLLPDAVAAPGELDAIFDALSHRRRRFALYCLVQLPDGVAELPALADDVRAIEAAADDVAAPPPEEAIQADLHHAHMPKLVDAGVVDYDPRQGTVRYEQVPSLEEWVDHAHYKEVGAPLGQ